jgi:ankyrin repeat protein
MFLFSKNLKGYPDLTRLLILYGLSSKKIDSYGQTLMHLACLSGNLNIVQDLIEKVINYLNSSM